VNWIAFWVGFVATFAFIAAWPHIRDALAARRKRRIRSAAGRKAWETRKKNLEKANRELTKSLSNLVDAADELEAAQ
jgi:hypothetical protein